MKEYQYQLYKCLGIEADFCTAYHIVCFEDNNPRHIFLHPPQNSKKLVTLPEKYGGMPVVWYLLGNMFNFTAGAEAVLKIEG